MPSDVTVEQPSSADWAAIFTCAPCTLACCVTAWLCVGPPGFELKSDGERALSRAMGCYWTNFATSGNPNKVRRTPVLLDVLGIASSKTLVRRSYPLVHMYHRCDRLTLRLTYDTSMPTMRRVPAVVRLYFRNGLALVPTATPLFSPTQLSMQSKLSKRTSAMHLLNSPS